MPDTGATRQSRLITPREQYYDQVRYADVEAGDGGYNAVNPRLTADIFSDTHATTATVVYGAPDLWYSNTAVVQAVAEDGLLSDGSVTPEQTSAILSVDCSTDVGKLYCSLRTSGPYGTGDGDVIVDGPFDWQGIIDPPIIGTNNFNATGLASGVQHYAAFMQREEVVAPPTVSYEHYFNADPGGFSLVATDDNWGYTGTEWKKVSSAYHAFYGCDHDGTEFVPTAGYRGMAISGGCDTVLTPNQDVATNWSVPADITVGTQTVQGDMTLDRLTYSTASPAQAYISHACDEDTSGPWSWGAYVIKGTTTGCTMEVDQSRGFVNFLWVGDTLTVDSFGDSAEGFAINVGGDLWKIGMFTTGTSTAPKTILFYPEIKGGSVSSGTYIDYSPGVMVDEDVCAGEWFPVTSSTTVTKAPLGAALDLSTTNMPSGVIGSFTVHFKYYHLAKPDENSSRYLACFYLDNSNYVRVQYLTGGTKIQFDVKRGGTSRKLTSNHAVPTDGLIDIRFKIDAATGAWKVWVWGLDEKTGTTDTGSFTSPITHFSLGEREPDRMSLVDTCPLVWQHIKIYPEALSDAEIEAWT